MGWGGDTLPRGTSQAMGGVYKLPREWFSAWERLSEAVKSSLYYLEPQFGWQPTTFHRPQIYLLSYYIDFRQLRFGLQMKVNAGGCTHRDKLDVVSKYKIFTVPAY